MIKGVKMSESAYCVYKHTSPSGKAYIGQTKNYQSRYNEHKKCRTDTVFSTAIKKYGLDNFTHEILKDNLTLEQANYWEEKLIKEMNTLHPNGYNLKHGGKNHSHSEISIEKMRYFQKYVKPKPSEETKRKISEYQTSRPRRSKETRDKLSKALIGIKRSDETKRKVSESLKGKTHSDDTKAKMSESHKGKVKTKEHQDKITAALKGRKMPKQSKEQIEKRVATMKANKAARVSESRADFEANCARAFLSSPLQLSIKP